MAEIGEGVKSELKEIRYFRVTDRGLGDYERFCHFEGAKIASNSVVVDVGSGWNQELSADLEKLNKGIKTISLDATLAIPPEGIKGVSYKKGERGRRTHKVSKEEQKERLLKTRENSVAAVMPEIPLKDEVADMVLDCYGPATYLSDEKWADYIFEVGRVLKNGGEAHMFPIDEFNNFVLNLDKDRSEVSANKRLNLLEGVLKEKGLKLDKYSQDDGEGNNRVGMVIKKEVESNSDIESDKNVLGFREADVERLRDQLKQSDGKVRVWIHPYYMGDDRDYVPVMEKIVSKVGEEKGVPNVFFMPDDQLFERDRVRILDLAAGGGDKCYFIRTYSGNPRPVMDESMGVRAWDVLRDLFKMAGVEECLVGGEYASKEEVSSDIVGVASGCVNEAMNQLSVSFRVERSNAAFPFNRADALREEMKVK